MLIVTADFAAPSGSPVPSLAAWALALVAVLLVAASGLLETTATRA